MKPPGRRVFPDDERLVQREMAEGGNQQTAATGPNVRVRPRPPTCRYCFTKLSMMAEFPVGASAVMSIL